MRHFLRAIALALLTTAGSAPAWADTVSYAMSLSWQKIATAGQTVEVQNTSSVPASVTTSTGSPSSASGQILAAGDHRVYALTSDLYAMGSPFGALVVSTGFATGASGGSTIVAPTTGLGGYSGVVVGTAAAQILAVRSAGHDLVLANQSTTASIAVCLGTCTPALNTAGSFTIQPGQILSWPSAVSSYVPLDAINAVASAANTPLTVGAH